MCVKYTKAKDAQNAINAISCLSGFLRMELFYQPCLKRFKTMLAHSSKPFIRYQSAEKLIQSLEIISIMTEVPEEATQLLKETDWVADIDPEIFKTNSTRIYSSLSPLF